VVLAEELRDPSDAIRIAERIRERLAAPFEVDGRGRRQPAVELLQDSEGVGVKSTVLTRGSTQEAADSYPF
jgi:hypothetical protein